MIRVDLLGGVEVSGADPAQIQVSSRAVSLLAYLVSHAEIPQPRAHLAGLLWPNSASGQARTNLRRELHHLRVLLRGSECLQADDRSLCWRSGSGCVADVHELLTASHNALAAAESEDREGVELYSGRALELYRGDFLPGCYDDWALSVRQDLKGTCVEMCDQISAYWLSCGDPTAAAVFARRRVLLEPLEEPGYRRLMRTQLEAGDRAGAMRTYHQCASLLERELGFGPSPETRAELDAALSDIGRGTGDPGVVSAENATWPLSPGVVGRGAERDRLLAAWSGAQSGCRFVVVTGEAGVGKTRLVADLAGAVRSQGGLVAATRCFTATGSVPLAPVADWLRSPHLRMATKRLDPVWRS